MEHSKTALSDAIYFLENQQCLHREAAIVSRLLYLMGRKFRHDIGHSYVRRTNIALLKYLNFEILNDLKTFLSMLPTNSSSDIYLPTRQMLEYVLVRFQTFAKIVFRIVICSKNAATFYFERIKRGDSAWLSLMPYTVLSRVWHLTNRLVQNSCKWYKKILTLRDNLKLVGVPFLPSDYILPSNLFEWLEYDVFENDSKLLWKSGANNIVSDFIQSVLSADSFNKNILDIPELKDDDNPAELVKSILHVNRKPKDIIQTIQYENMQPKSNITKISNNDLGEKISRKEFMKIQKSSYSVSNDLKNKIIKSDNIDNSNILIKNSIPFNNTFEKISNIIPIQSEDKPIKSNKKSDKISSINSNCKPKTVKISNGLASDIKAASLPISDDKFHIKKSQKRSHHSIDSIECSKSLVKLLKTEESLRNANDSLSLTKDIGLVQWQSLKKVSIKLAKKMDNSNKAKQEKIIVKLKDYWVSLCNS